MDNKEAIERLKVIMVGNSNSKLNQALSHAIEVMKASEWQPIESAPRDGTEIVIMDQCGIVRHVLWDKYISFPPDINGAWETKVFDEEHHLNPKNQKYWKPIQPPKEGE